jgi:hypothetical protein
MHKIARERAPITYFSDMMRKGHAYSFSRYGDGEWHAMFGRSGANCDGHKYFPKMGRELARTVREPRKLIYGIQNMSARKLGDKIKPLLKPNYDYKWKDADVFHYASWNGVLFPMVQALRAKKVCLVGPKFLKKPALSFLYSGGFVEVPEKNCYHNKKHIKARMRQELADQKVFCICASMLAEILIWELFPTLGETCWLIDFGSVWDVYARHPSRRYHKHVNARVRKKNLHNDVV